MMQTGDHLPRLFAADQRQVERWQSRPAAWSLDFTFQPKNGDGMNRGLRGLMRMEELARIAF